jgi:hypothetical protein
MDRRGLVVAGQRALLVVQVRGMRLGRHHGLLADVRASVAHLGEW